MARRGISSDALRALMKKAQSGSSAALSTSVGLFEDDWLADEAFNAGRLAEWLEEVESIESMFPRAVSRLNTGRQFSTTIDRIYETGMMQGTWTDGKRTFQVYLSTDQDPSPAGCSCEESGGIEPCLHSYGFAKQTLLNLKTDKSLQKRIEERGFASGTPSMRYYEPDATDLALTRLKAIVSESAKKLSVAMSPDDDALPTAAPPALKRLMWNLCVSESGEVTIEAVIQQKKKRGDGYTKGKKTKWSTLREKDDIQWQPRDRAVIALIERPAAYYYGPDYYQLDPVDAISSLIGAANVSLNGEPCVVKPGIILIGCGADSSGEVGPCMVNLDGSLCRASLMSSDDTLLQIDLDQSVISVCKSSTSELDVVTSLLQLPDVAGERKNELFEQLAQLQNRLSVALPDLVGGKLETYEAKAAILLRSQPNGTLDFGLRIRDALGVLRKPLASPFVVVVERDGKKVQMIRTLESETTLVDRLLADWDLEIDPDTGFGTIDDFDVALQLIERLQSPECEIEVLWDRTTEKPVTVLGNLSSSNVKVDITNKRNWFGITGECQFGDKSIPLNELMANLPRGDDGTVGSFVKLADGQWARISEGLRARLKRLQDAIHTDRNALRMDATAAPIMRELVESDVSIKASKAWEKCIKRLANAEKLDPQLPENLDANLRDYQVDGYRWLRKLAEWGVGGILADDMGLGKTLQTLAVLLDRAADGPALVIAPTTVGFNWVREAERFTPDLDVHLYRETDRADFLTTIGPGSLVICSYGLALRDAEALGGVEWSTMVLDEAQAIKNSRSKTSKAIASIDADWTVALTGTPVENHLGELWSLFHVVSPGVFGGWENFRKRFAAPIEKERDEEARKSLAERLKPFVLRRTKSEVLTELPPRTEMNLYVDLSPAERAEYEQIRLVAIGEIDALEALPQIQDQRFKILAMMTRLRQIACHAGLVNKEWTGSSAKLDQLCETLESLREEGHRALVFSQFTQHLALIRTALEQRGFTYEYLDGSTPAKKRQEAVDRFQEGSANAFLISLKAGGTGLNLTAADYVIHMDPWWNPAVEDQATDRAHRMGQDKPVMVYRIVARGTIEEEILALHDSKRDLVAGVMQGTEAAAKMTNEDLIRMLRV